MSQNYPQFQKCFLSNNTLNNVHMYIVHACVIYVYMYVVYMLVLTCHALCADVHVCLMGKHAGRCIYKENQMSYLLLF